MPSFDGRDRVDVVASRHMSSGMSVESARRRFTGKRADTVLKLVRATLEVLRDVGYQELTLQAVAAQAGLARATAYTYFSSKEHLIAEVFWRRMSSIEPAVGETDVVERVAGVLRDLAFIVSDEPALAHAVAVTMNSGDPDVELLRVQMGRFVRDLLMSAVDAGRGLGIRRAAGADLCRRDDPRSQRHDVLPRGRRPT